MPLLHIVCGPIGIIAAAIVLAIRYRLLHSRRAKSVVLPFHEKQHHLPPSFFDIKEPHELAVVVAEIPGRVQHMRPRLNSFCVVGERFGAPHGLAVQGCEEKDCDAVAARG